MRLQLACTTCEVNAAERAVSVEVQDDGVYVLECEAGHRTVHILSNPKFEILFELALLALADGYTRESVTTLAAAVEEFFRLYINAVFYSRDLYYDEAYAEVKAFWKLADRAEPQLGAFAAAYLLDQRTAPPFPTLDWITFRNGVVHRGKIPRFSEVMTYGEKIVAFVIPLYRQYWKGELPMVVVDSVAKVEALRRRGEKASSGSTNRATAIRHLVHMNEIPTFALALEYARASSFFKAPIYRV